MARMKAQDFPPWTQTFVEEVSIVLDRFHRDNHTWCLTHMPEVDPLQPANTELLANTNTEACEQLNSWISGRTASGLEMTGGHFAVYWWALFDTHNEWLDHQAKCKRRRFASGGQGRDPDKPNMRNK